MPLPDGLYDQLVDATLLREISALVDSGRATLTALSAEERAARLAEAIGKILENLLDAVDPDEDGAPREQMQLAVIATLLGALRNQTKEDLPNWPSPISTLRSIHRGSAEFRAPPTGVLRPWLFTAGRADPSLLADLRSELDSCEDVDILVSFIKWSGVRKLLDVFQSGAVTDAHGKPRRGVRILTTTYMGATEARAIVALAKLPGVSVKISYDTRRTRLHAKAWLFHRSTGYGSAFVGSANISNAALIGGLEWTVKFTQAAQKDLYLAAKAQFDSLWNDKEFEQFDANDEAAVRRLSAALSEEGRTSDGDFLALFDLSPKAYQLEMLNRLDIERQHDRRRNLVVAATGTGKTVVAALDYARIAQASGNLPRLLFVAHRVEILQQAMGTYRQALRSPSFGELLAEGRTPTSFDHLFASIQSVGSNDLINRFGPEYWHVVVIDECHHLPAQSFDRFARGIRPRFLLGLTATPLRSDGKPIGDYFDRRPDGRAAVELRLWDALDQQLLSPFEYYGTADETDLSGVKWDSGAAEHAALDNLISGDTVRARLVLRTLHNYCSNIRELRGLAFCVSVRHAEFMSEQLKLAGVGAMCVTGDTDRATRSRVPEMLRSGEVRVICTCDLYNEGVDFPEINTLLLLRPTQSAVLFEQQLGRGLRLFPGKETCVVLDFVGRFREEFRFDQLLQVMTGLPKRRILEDLEHGFPTLPPGCHISFDRVAQERVLASLKAISQQTWRRLSRELQGYATFKSGEEVSLPGFLHDQALEVADVYRLNAIAGWTALKRNAGLLPIQASEEERYLGSKFSSLIHNSDIQYLDIWRAASNMGTGAWSLLSPSDKTRLQMLAYQLYPGINVKIDGEEFLRRLALLPELKVELGELADLLLSRSMDRPIPIPAFPAAWPLNLHCRYEIREILTAVGWLTPTARQPLQAGKVALKDRKIEILFVTLDKSLGYHDRISYHDYAISPELFHWETQNNVAADSEIGRRYSESPSNGWRFFLFVRESPDVAYYAIGPGVKEDVSGNKPLALQWRLTVPLPIDMFRAFSVLRT